MLPILILLGLGLAGAAYAGRSRSSSLFTTPEERAELERARAAQLAGTPEQRTAPDIRRSWTQIATTLTTGGSIDVAAVEALATTFERQGFPALAAGLRSRMRAASAPPTLPPLHPGTSAAERRELEAWARLGDGRDNAIEVWNTSLRLLEQASLTEAQRAQVVEAANEATRLGLDEAAAGLRRRLARLDRSDVPRRQGSTPSRDRSSAPCVARWSAQDRATGRRRDLGCFATLYEARRGSARVQASGLVAFERSAPRHPSGREWCEVLSSDLTLEDLRDREGLARWAGCPTRDESEIATMTARLDRAFQDAPTDQDAMMYGQIRDGMRRVFESRA